jgi:hypothetical protein
LKRAQYPTIVKFFDLGWLEDNRNSNHVLWIRWNQGDQFNFLERWERALAFLDSKGLVRRKIVHMMKIPNQFLDTMAQVEVAAVLLTKGLMLELEASKSGKTPDIFLTGEEVCIEVKNLHTDPVLEQATSG